MVRTKKATARGTAGRASKPKARKAADYDSDAGSVEDGPSSKKQKTAPSRDMQIDDEGKEYWEISGKRRLQISDYDGNTFIAIREFYEKDGKTLPGKKGISMSVEQYAAVVELLPQIEGVLKGRGVEVPRPKYGEGAVQAPKEEVEDEDAGDGQEDEREDGMDDEKEDGHEVEEDGNDVEESKSEGRLDRFKMTSKEEKDEYEGDEE
ncbi:uncharacterized protein LTR77_006040 [Saxophila tyrrhenica]|uniref:Transcriptional coactivator p15 (PC4) C-terminal domain-containing protein n=1 Tax=Saxophila tyrrhenica TaxID=1690608 RepID=A0AAV9P705_9PEZI|nr:hypothetical protein LTR77_006040 [Saxophila tyrrhenica]